MIQSLTFSQLEKTILFARHIAVFFENAQTKKTSCNHNPLVVCSAVFLEDLCSHSNVGKIVEYENNCHAFKTCL